MSAATEKQENTSRLFFESYLNASGNLTQYQKDQLEQAAFFGPSATYPDVGMRNGQPINTPFARAWRQNFYSQLEALGMFMSSYGVHNKNGWQWSRGNGMMGFLNSIALQRCGVSTLDNWNPMDIVGVQASADSIIRQTCEAMIIPNPQTAAQKETNKGILNEIMIEMIEENKLMPISLKFIDERKRERPSFEVSRELKTAAQTLAAVRHFRIAELKCDLNWNVAAREWTSNQEFSYFLRDRDLSIKIQGRAFGARAARENPQHEGTPEGAGAKLGKAAIQELRNFVTNIQLVPPDTPTQHPQIPAAGQTWTNEMKGYWVSLQNSLASATIGGAPINFMSPGTTTQNGFRAALDAACDDDENERFVANDPKVPCGNRLCTKLWALEWLKVYQQIDNANRFDAFMQCMYKACKKEAPGMGPFIKIAGA